ncbi:hypothetical protein HGP16_33535 [Rhizobium sp. P40RR-XXII]|uniref:hypothetical protein n=1 Tax=Rhizobium sp. P40RR-XXII TaxID=2726739 RepID=UPI001457892D|nr:hypothetical protein [Rhizobium sp. P40RR-XXII]NLS21412.1 hypothetical protein [Rhizobium sp. P40RR-XXII]
MTTHNHNPLLTLYGTPRAVIRARVSVRAKPIESSSEHSEQENTEKIGNSIVSLTSLKDHLRTSR